MFRQSYADIEVCDIPPTADRSQRHTLIIQVVIYLLGDVNVVKQSNEIIKKLPQKCVQN